MTFRILPASPLVWEDEFRDRGETEDAARGPVRVSSLRPRGGTLAHEVSGPRPARARATTLPQAGVQRGDAVTSAHRQAGCR